MVRGGPSAHQGLLGRCRGPEKMLSMVVDTHPAWRGRTGPRVTWTGRLEQGREAGAAAQPFTASSAATASTNCL